MADADEDLLESSASHVLDADSETLEVEEDDETQDFRFLNLTSTKGPLPPRRGQKDFEPHETILQASTLAASRQAMRDVLSYEREHTPKNHTIGVYDRHTGMTRVRRPRGQVFRSIGSGKGFKHGEIELLPEEALWMLERGALDVRWGREEGVAAETEPVDDDENAEKDEKDRDVGQARQEMELLPMSLQGGYVSFIGEEERRGGGLTSEKYIVYAHLKRAGLTVLRADEWGGVCQSSSLDALDDSPKSDGRISKDDAIRGVPPWPFYLSLRWRGLLPWLFDLILRRRRDCVHGHSRQRSGPLVTAGLYGTYDDIYERLRLIPDYEATRTSETHSEKMFLPLEHDILSKDAIQSANPFTTTYNVFKPSPTFKLSSPGPPDFRICVVSARDTSLPTLSDLSTLMAQQPLDTQSMAEEISSEKLEPISKIYGRLKHGRRNMILAVVDEGIVSYMRVADCEFSREKLYKRVSIAARNEGGKGSKNRSRSDTPMKGRVRRDAVALNA